MFNSFARGLLNPARFVGTVGTVGTAGTTGTVGTLSRALASRFLSTSRTTPKYSSSNRLKNSLYAASLSVLLGYTTYKWTDLSIKNDSDTSTGNDSVSVDSSIDPLPLTIDDPLTTEFQLLGYGVRNVTFLHMKVYALGLYIAKDDLSLVKRILSSKFLESLYEKPNPELSQKEALKVALDDDKMSEVLVENLLNSGVRFTARICALRNTDLSHLRDGFIRTIKNSEKYKQIMKQDDDESLRLSDGLDSLRAVMNSHHMKAYQNSRVFMEIIQDGKIRVTARVYDRYHFRDPVLLGIVDEPLVSKLLFLCYLSGPKPLVRDVRDSSAESLVSMF
ncbi:DEKNAAC103495 [Brettanomyces naardenensis]|uniref:Altered inheritance of mitochondria protein 18, mitochondrial n=1 Tax=Brettanomyces naardenensis TaxID=13370 RepID=A0A448YP06_BRENA|nr:DEKNAAC103495 [Brettanomyces naardenensis]